MNHKVCIITGANAGIGKQAAMQIANEGCHVIIACRSEERGNQALGDIRKQTTAGSVELMLLDMSSQASIRAFAQEVLRKFEKVDILIHNAAHFDIAQKKAQYSTEGIETVWATNHIGPVLLTDLLMESLKKSENGRVITISSKGLIVKPGTIVDLSDPEFKNSKFNVTKAYYQSKRAQEMYTLWLADKLKETNVTANCIRVTAVKIDISRYPGISSLARFAYSIKSKHSITPEEMARTYTYLALSKEVTGISGQCFDQKNAQLKYNSYTTNTANIEALMNLTMKYLKSR